MSHNWTKGDLAAVLKTMVVAARDLLPGDVILADYGPWQVAKAILLPDGRIEALDEDGNGGALPADSKVRIVIRSALRSNP